MLHGRNILKAIKKYLSERLSKQEGQKVSDVDAMYKSAYSLYSKVFSKQSQLCLKVTCSFSLKTQQQLAASNITLLKLPIVCSHGICFDSA